MSLEKNWLEVVILELQKEQFLLMVICENNFKDAKLESATFVFNNWLRIDITRTEFFFFPFSPKQANCFRHKVVCF